MKVGDLVAYKTHLRMMEHGDELGIVLHIRRCAIGKAVLINWSRGVGTSLKNNLMVVNEI